MSGLGIVPWRRIPAPIQKEIEEELLRVFQDTEVLDREISRMKAWEKPPVMKKMGQLIGISVAFTVINKHLLD